MTNSTLVYSPEVRVIIQSDGIDHDISGDIVSGNITRRLDTTSSVNILVANKELKYNNMFKRMDKITVFCKRTQWVQVFSGYLDTVPIFQLYPGVVSFTASCTLKRIVHTWWDPGLPASMEIMNQQKHDQDAAQALEDAGTPTADATSGSMSLAESPDAGLGLMLKRILMEVGGWDENQIFIQDIPTSFIDFLAENIANYDNNEAVEKFKDLFGWNETISASSGGGGGGDLSSIEFTDIGPPANGQAYSPDEIVQIVEAAGWTGEDIAIGASIVMAESQGNPAAVNAANSNGTVDRGLWQINSIHDAKRNGGDWFDPAVSTRMARQIYQDAGNSWTPWSTYSYHGTYQKYLPQMREAAARLQKGGGGNIVNKGKSGKSNTGKPNEQSDKHPSGLKQATKLLNNVNKAVNGINDSFNGIASNLDGADPSKKDHNISETPSPPPSEGTTGNAYIGTLGGKAPNTQGMSVADSIAAVALYKFPMMTYTSGLRFTDSGYHSKGMAADISNGGDAGTPEMKALAQWWVDNFLGKGLLQLIHNPFDHNIYEDRDVGDGVALYTAGTMAEHRNHVHIAMSGVVSVDGTSDGTAGSGGGAGGVQVKFENKLGKSLFNYIFDPYANDVSGVSQLLEGERAPANDEPLVKTVASICAASLLRYQSSPSGDFVAFYPDYFGIDHANKAVLALEDIELKDFQINASDNSFTTHVYVRGNDSVLRDGFAGELGLIGTHGVATIENEWLFNRLVTATLVKPEFATKEETLSRYGLRPLTTTLSNVTTSEMEFLAACKLFMQKWAEQYSTVVEMTFMPELFPGMRVTLVGHGVTVFVEEVSHNFSYEGGGFNTSVTISSPAPAEGSSAIIEGIR